MVDTVLQHVQHNWYFGNDRKYAKMEGIHSSSRRLLNNNIHTYQWLKVLQLWARIGDHFCTSDWSENLIKLDQSETTIQPLSRRFPYFESRYCISYWTVAHLLWKTFKTVLCWTVLLAMPICRPDITSFKN